MSDAAGTSDGRAAAVFMCGPLAGVSGGDVHALRLVWEWNERAPGSALLIAPASVRDATPVSDVGFLAVRTPLDRWLRGLASYAVIIAFRALVAAVTAPRARFAVAASHFVQDLIPMAVHRLRYRSQAVVYVYHLVADMNRRPDLRSRLSLMAERISITLIRAADAIVFVDNDETLRSLEKRGLPRHRLLLTRNAYDPVEPMPPRADASPPIIAFVGRFTEEKGIWDMLDLAEELRRRATRAGIEMLGAGPLLREFAERAERAGLSNLAVRGFVDESAKWRMLRAATVFAAPSREEGWGIAVGEALTAGLPVVAYDLPAYGHLGDLPIRIRPGDVQGFVAAVVELLTEPDRLARERERIARAATLPTWSEVLAREIAALEGGHYSAAPR